MNSTVKLLLIVSLIGISSSYPQSPDQPQVEDLQSPTKDILKPQIPPIASNSRDIPKDAVKTKRQTPQQPQPQPPRTPPPGVQVDPIRQTRQTKDIPKDSVPRVRRQAPPPQQPQVQPPRPGPLPDNLTRPQIQPVRQTRQTRDEQKDKPTKDIPKDTIVAPQTLPAKVDRTRRDTVAVPIPQPLPDESHPGQHTKDIPKKEVLPAPPQ